MLVSQTFYFAEYIKALINTDVVNRDTNIWISCKLHCLLLSEHILFPFLHDSFSDVTKYFGIEMGAQTNIDDKNDRYIVNGAHSAEDLQIQLDGFIQKFVLCPNCDSPETELNVVKKTIYQKCAACGYTGLLKYSTHRLFNYILNRPPTKTAKYVGMGKQDYLCQ